MAVYVIAGDESLISLELTNLLHQLIGDEDRSMMLEDIDAADSGTTATGIADALHTPPMFTERRVVLVRNVHDMTADMVSQFAASIDSMNDTTDLVATITGRQPKVLSDAFKKAAARTVGATVPSGAKDRLAWIESHLVEAGLSYSPDAARLISLWFGNDQGRLAGLIQTLRATYEEGTKLSRADVEVFLGEAGSIAPWDLTDAIDVGDVNKALVMLHRIMIDSHPLQVLALLANRFANMMKLDGPSVQTVTDAVGVLGGKEFTARKVLEQYQRLGSSGVSQAMSLIAQADVDLRGGKEWDDVLVMEVLVARLARLGRLGSHSGPTRSRMKA
jgi:DNA polymerase III subunit delta